MSHINFDENQTTVIGTVNEEICDCMSFASLTRKILNGVKSSSMQLAHNVSAIRYSYGVNYADCVRLL